MCKISVTIFGGCYQLKGRGGTFWTAGQCLDPARTDTPFVWKRNPNSDMVSDMAYKNWMPGEPNNWRNSGESCVQMVSGRSFKWNDCPCDLNPMCSVCEIDLDTSAERPKLFRLALKPPVGTQ